MKHNLTLKREHIFYAALNFMLSWQWDYMRAQRQCNKLHMNDDLRVNKMAIWVISLEVQNIK